MWSMRWRPLQRATSGHGGGIRCFRFVSTYWWRLNTTSVFCAATRKSLWRSFTAPFRRVVEKLYMCARVRHDAVRVHVCVWMPPKCIGRFWYQYWAILITSVLDLKIKVRYLLNFAVLAIAKQRLDVVCGKHLHVDDGRLAVEFQPVVNVLDLQIQGYRVQ